MKTPISYYGGKQQLLPKILPLVPKHNIYTESFAGGAALFWAKDPSKIEIINDQNGEVTNFYYCLQNHFKQLQSLVRSTLHSRESYLDAKHIYERPHLHTKVRRAWAFYVATQQGFVSKIGSWGYDKKKPSMGIKLANKREAFKTYYQERLSYVQIENNDAVKIIGSRDDPEAFHYVDPPYVNSNCGHYSGYKVSDYQALLQTLGAVKGKFLLSSYPSEELSQAVRKYGWISDEITMRMSARKGKSKVEVLTRNYEV
jgi:DNA adenine methylase